MKNRRIAVISFLLALIAAAAGAGLWCWGQRGVPVVARDRQLVSSSEGVAKAAAPAVGARAEKGQPAVATGKQEEPVNSGPAGAEPSPAASDAASVGEALEWARRQMRSPDAAVRAEAVRVFGRIGVKALPEITGLVSDPDGGVCQAAFQQWKPMVTALPVEAKRIQIVQAVMSVMDDREKLDDLAAMLSAFPKPLAVRNLVSVIQSPNPYATEAARAAYQRLTGAAYISPSASEEWIKKNVDVSK